MLSWQIGLIVLIRVCVDLELVPSEVDDELSELSEQLEMDSDTFERYDEYQLLADELERSGRAEDVHSAAF